jgi:hypothetical protein
VKPEPANSAFAIDRDYLVLAFKIEGLGEKPALTAAGVEPHVFKRRVGSAFPK